MPDLQKSLHQIEERLGEVSREVLRIEAHLRRGEERAARARIKGVREHLHALHSDADTPLQFTMVGAQMGLMSGGNWLRGRLPSALLFGIGGWLFGQHQVDSQRREVQSLLAYVDSLAEQIDAAEIAGDAEMSPSSSQSAPKS